MKNLIGPILLKALLEKDTKTINALRATMDIAPFQNFVINIQAQGYNIIDTPWDGNCFFRILAQQLDPTGLVHTHQTLRQMAANYITNHPDEFAGFIEPLYANNLQREGFAADDPAITALARALNINLAIHRADGTINHIVNDPNNINHELGFTGGHYVMITPIATADIVNNILTEIINSAMVNIQPAPVPIIGLVSASSSANSHNIDDYRLLAAQRFNEHRAISNLDPEIPPTEHSYDYIYHMIGGLTTILLAVTFYHWWHDDDH